MTWKIAKLGEVCKIQSGNSIPIKEKDSLYRNVDNGLPYIATKDVSFDGIINYENGVRIPTKYNSKFRISKKNSTLLCGEGGSAGRKIAFSTKDCHFVNKLFSIYAGNEIVPKFIYYYTLSYSFQKQFKKALHGLIGGVSLSKIKNFKIAYPTHLEQKSIVTKLDTVFDKINKSISLTKKKKIEDKNIRKSILKSIFIKNISHKKIGEIASVIAGQSPDGKYYNKIGQGVPFYQGKKEFGDHELKKPNVWTTKTTKQSLKGDVLLSVRAPVGDTNINNQRICIGRGLAAIRANPEFNSEFIYYFLNSIKDKIVGNEGAVFNSLNKTQIENILIPTPSFEEQAKIVNKIKSIFFHINQIDLLTKKKLDNLDALKFSILSKEIQNYS